MTTMMAMEVQMNELYHHGVKGMKWGVRRTREQLGYPESRRKKQTVKSKKRSRSSKDKQFSRLRSIAEKKNQNSREEILKSPTKLYRHREEFTKQEIDDAIRRFETERKLNELSAYELNAGKRYVDALLGYADTGIKAYNTYAKLHNAFGKGEKLKQIGQDGKKDKKKDKDDD